ncbi:unnamed protein product [Phaedon cochleariae]|uniref:BED-type domain-containing protein n=1 Tax=Phaedon cochleariae TaxID=80249 RepID=A0A9N9SIC7_PHACE|nr:unnamed protein product [Phaedon cochleariae]
MSHLGLEESENLLEDETIEEEDKPRIPEVTKRRPTLQNVTNDIQNLRKEKNEVKKRKPDIPLDELVQTCTNVGKTLNKFLNNPSSDGNLESDSDNKSDEDNQSSNEVEVEDDIESDDDDEMIEPSQRLPSSTIALPSSTIALPSTKSDSDNKSDEDNQSSNEVEVEDDIESDDDDEMIEPSQRLPSSTIALPSSTIALPSTRTSQSDADIGDSRPAVSVSISEENLTSAEETEEQNPTPRKKKSYKQKYKAKWTSDEDFSYWLEKTPQNQAKCKVCNKILAGGITHIRRHSKTATHSRLVQASRKTPSISKSFECDKVKQFNDKVREGEIKLILFLAEHNLPFLLLDHLSKLLPSICTDSEIAKSVHLSRFKGTALCTNLIGPHNSEILSKDLKRNYFSLIIDETTDIGSKKSLAVVARYFKEDAGGTQDRFLALLEVADGTAKGLYNAIKNLLTELDIPQKNMLGFAADNANVMMGNKTGIQALFKEEQQNMFILGCVCHSFHLASSAAC